MPFIRRAVFEQSEKNWHFTTDFEKNGDSQSIMVKVIDQAKIRFVYDREAGHFKTITIQLDKPYKPNAFVKVNKLFWQQTFEIPEGLKQPVLVKFEQDYSYSAGFNTTKSHFVVDYTNYEIAE